MKKISQKKLFLGILGATILACGALSITHTALQKKDASSVTQEMNIERPDTSQLREDVGLAILRNYDQTGGKVSYADETTRISTDESSPSQTDKAQDTSPTPIDIAAYSIPFDKSDEFTYVSNKELIESLHTDKDKERVNSAIAFAQNYMTDLLGTGYRQIKEDRSAYTDKLKKYLPGKDLITDDLEEIYSEDEFLNNLADWFVENEVQADVSFETDDTLIYEDYYAFVRGVLTVKPYSCKADTMSPLVPMGIDYKNGGRYVFEVAVGFYGDNNEYGPSQKRFEIRDWYMVKKLD